MNICIVIDHLSAIAHFEREVAKLFIAYTGRYNRREIRVFEMNDQVYQTLNTAREGGVKLAILYTVSQRAIPHKLINSPEKQATDGAESVYLFFKNIGLTPNIKQPVVFKFAFLEGVGRWSDISDCKTTGSEEMDILCRYHNIDLHDTFSAARKLHSMFIYENDDISHLWWVLGYLIHYLDFRYRRIHIIMDASNYRTAYYIMLNAHSPFNWGRNTPVWSIPQGVTQIDPSVPFDADKLIELLQKNVLSQPQSPQLIINAVPWCEEYFIDAIADSRIATTCDTINILSMDSYLSSAHRIHTLAESQDGKIDAFAFDEKTGRSIDDVLDLLNNHNIRETKYPKILALLNDVLRQHPTKVGVPDILEIVSDIVHLID